jgi:hypothetical protein
MIRWSATALPLALRIHSPCLSNPDPETLTLDSQTDIGYSPKIKLPYAAYAKNGTAPVVTTDPMAQIGVRAC